MPTLHLIGSIKIQIYYLDHLPPHFHAEYNEYEVLIEIETLKVLKGQLPTSQMRKVNEWAANNKERLKYYWNAFNN